MRPASTRDVAWIVEGFVYEKASGDGRHHVVTTAVWKDDAAFECEDGLAWKDSGGGHQSTGEDENARRSIRSWCVHALPVLIARDEDDRGPRSGQPLHVSMTLPRARPRAKIVLRIVRSRPR